MDHHCPWVGNCVGVMNHKFFWNFLTFATLGTLNTALGLALGKNWRENFNLEYDTFYVIATVISCAFSLSIGGLCGLHTFMLGRNHTSIESHLLEK